MEYKAKLSYLKISPRKVRLVADLVRGHSVGEARMQLRYSNKRASNALLKLLNSAVSNAKDINEEVNENDLRVKEIRVDEGPMLKRYMPVARGTVHEIQKKTSHVSLILQEQEKSEASSAKSQPAKKTDETSSKPQKEKIKTKTKKS